MKIYHLVFLLFLLSSVFSQTHNTSKINLDYYTFDEALAEIQTQFEYQNQDYGWWYCDLPFLLRWVCHTPLYPQPDYNLSNVNNVKTEFNKDNLIPYYSLVDVDAMLEHYSEYIHHKIAFSLNQNQQDFYQIIPVDQRQEMMSYEGFDSWDEYISAQNEQFVQQVILEVFQSYTDGFVQLNEGDNIPYGPMPVQTWSALDNGYGLQWLTFPFVSSNIEMGGDIKVLRQTEAEAFFAAKPVLIRTTHSLFAKNFSYDLQNPSDELVWVHGDKALGFFTQKKYQIVDENGQALAPLEDGVATRFGIKAVGDYQATDIRVLFDMVEVEE